MSIEYKKLDRKVKEKLADTIVKWLKKKYNDEPQKMNIWICRIEQILIEKEDRFKIKVIFDSSSYRSLFDIAFKDHKLFQCICEIKDLQYLFTAS